MDKETLAGEMGVTTAELDKRVARNQRRSLTQSERPRRNPEAFRELSENKPDEGEILEAGDQSSVSVFEDWKENEGEPVRLLIVNAAIDEGATGWFLHSKKFGLKCLIALHSHELVQEDEDGYFIDRVRVIRRTDKGSGLVVEAIPID